MAKKQRSNAVKSTGEEAIDEEYWDAEEAAACDGITIMKRWPVPRSKGKTKLYPGKVTYLGEKERPYCFEVEYEDDEETMCLAEVLMLQKKNKSSTDKKKTKLNSNVLTAAPPTKKTSLSLVISHGAANSPDAEGNHMMYEDDLDDHHQEDPVADEGIFDILETSAPKTALSFGVGHVAGEEGDTFVVCFGSWVESLQKWSEKAKPREVRSDSHTRIAKKAQWFTLEWLGALMAAFEGEVNSRSGFEVKPPSTWKATKMMGRIRIKKSVEDLSSYIVKTEAQVRCCILHGAFLSSLMMGLISTLPPPPFEFSSNTFPSWVIAIAPSTLWPREEVDFSLLMHVDVPQEHEEGFDEGATRAEGVD